MGEYWMPVNLTKKTYVHAHRVDEGLKLGEWGNPHSAVLAILSRWSHEDDIRVVSDYGGDLRITPAAKAGEDRAELYDLIQDDPAFVNLTSLEGTPNTVLLRAFFEAAEPHMRDRGYYDEWRDEWQSYLKTIA